MLTIAGRLFAAGLLYAFISFLAGGPIIPCPIHALTGLYCPGCGVSRMCLKLLTLDVAGALRENAALLLLSPVGLLLAVWMCVRYVRTGSRMPTRAQSAVIIGLVAVLLVFGVVRNLPGFSFLRPV